MIIHSKTNQKEHAENACSLFFERDELISSLLAISSQTGASLREETYRKYWVEKFENIIILSDDPKGSLYIQLAELVHMQDIAARNEIMYLYRVGISILLALLKEEQS